MLRSTTMRLSSKLLNNFQRCASTTKPATTLEKISDDVQDPGTAVISDGTKDISASSSSTASKNEVRGKSRMVTSAFASLQPQYSSPNRSLIDESIQKAKTPEELLNLSNNAVLTNKQALKIVTTLSEWSLNGKANDVESDPRFAALCQVVTRSSAIRNPSAYKDGDLSVVLGVMGEDEAAKMINSITLPQMIKVLSSLSFKKRRSLPLLKAIAFNIGRFTPKLDVKQAADILYAIASLHFPDEVLLEKVCSDLLETIPVCQKSAVIGSICTSIGHLRYKDTDLLECLCSWALKNNAITRHQDFVSLLLCLASVKQVPNQEIIDLIISNTQEDDLPSSSTWLDVVWSLAVLGSAPDTHISSVLSPKFIERLANTSVSSVSWKRKILNVNGLAKLTKGYKGPFLKEETNLEVPFTKSKDKQLLYTSVIDTLTNVFPSMNHFRTAVDTGMGFLIDAECMFDPKMNPIPLVDKKTGQPVQLNGKKKTRKKGERIAFLVHDYHDCTRGHVEPCGMASFHSHLLTLAGYKVIPLLYTDYNPQSKLLERAKYIDELLKSAISLPV